MFHINEEVRPLRAVVLMLFFVVPVFSSAQTQNYCLVFQGAQVACGYSFEACDAYAAAAGPFGAASCVPNTTETTPALVDIPFDVFSISSIQQDTVERTLNITMTPKYPGPHENVSVEISSNVADLNRSEIFWYANNQLIGSGVGKTAIDIETSRTGIATTLDIIIRTGDGLRLDKQIILQPAELTLVWEAESYTPPFYSGKALASPESKIKIVALPVFKTNGVTIAEETLIYIWRVNGKIILSGVGEMILETQSPKPYGTLDVSLEVSSPGGLITKNADLKVGVSSPEVILYEDHPLEGVRYTTALTGTFELTEEEISVQAEPYFFTDSGTFFTWYLNGEEFIGLQNSSLALRNENEGSGVSSIEVTARNMINTFQQAARKLFINFEIGARFN